MGRGQNRPIRHAGFQVGSRLRQRSDFWTATLITACWNGFGTGAISIAGGRGPGFRQARPGTSCVGPRASISIDRFPRRADPDPWVLAPLSWRRRSRYLPVARRSAVARVLRGARCGSADLSRPDALGRHAAGFPFLTHPSMPRDRAPWHTVSSAFPIGPAPSLT